MTDKIQNPNPLAISYPLDSEWPSPARIALAMWRDSSHGADYLTQTVRISTVEEARGLTPRPFTPRAFEGI